MKNKKGFLLAEETLKIVLALVCISFLVYFLASLYFNNKDDNNLELAKSSLEYLVSEAESFGEEGGIVEIYNPQGWVVSLWSENKMPNSCSNKGWDNCLCICKEELSTRTINGLISDCDNKGYCLESLELRIENERNFYKKSLSNSIEIKPVPLKLYIIDKEIRRAIE
jgi:hypothetical protein